MLALKEIVQVRLKEIGKEFEELRDKVVDAEKFAANGKIQMEILRGRFAENTNLIAAFEQEDEVEQTEFQAEEKKDV